MGNSTSRHQSVRDFLKAAGDRLDAFEAARNAYGLENPDEQLLWAVRDIRLAVHYLAEIVEREGNDG